MISNELFEQVLGKAYMLKAFPDKPSWVKWYANQFDVTHDIGVDVNIYELIRMCKDFAFDKGYRIQTLNIRKDCYKVTLLTNPDNKVVAEATDTSEPEATFKVLEWVLRNGSAKTHVVDFEDIIKNQNLSTFCSAYSDEDRELPYVFDLNWDIKSVGHLAYALSNECMYGPNDIESTMREYGLTEDNLKNYFKEKDEEDDY